MDTDHHKYLASVEDYNYSKEDNCDSEDDDYHGYDVKTCFEEQDITDTTDTNLVETLFEDVSSIQLLLKLMA